uniref:hypothetical protein n=1 Tax=Phocaeicola sp. TaxID=2773926 RepID=UPI003AB88676
LRLADLSVARDDILVGRELGQSHRAAGVEFLRRYPRCGQLAPAAGRIAAPPVFRKLPLRFQNNLNALPPRESIKIQQFINNLKNLRNFSYYKTQNQWFLKYQIIGLIKPLSQ